VRVGVGVALAAHPGHVLNDQHRRLVGVAGRLTRPDGRETSDPDCARRNRRDFSNFDCLVADIQSWHVVPTTHKPRDALVRPSGSSPEEAAKCNASPPSSADRCRVVRACHECRGWMDVALGSAAAELGVVSEAKRSLGRRLDGSFGHLLDHEHRRLIGIVVTHTDHAERSSAHLNRVDCHRRSMRSS
jgi:hypothetical protein